MNAPLYTTEILRLAAALPEPHPLAEVHGSAQRRSPTCGSTVAVEIEVDGDGRLRALSQRIQACAFGQASASLLVASAVGRSRGEVRQGHDELAAWLAGEREDPGSWPGLVALAPARARGSRHGAILLPFRALLAAFESAGE
jgi:NifU-like protein involved in Fe-S cluster formation